MWRDVANYVIAIPETSRYYLGIDHSYIEAQGV